MKRFQVVCLVALIILFCSPLLSTVLSALLSPETSQYAILQFIIMALYNLVFFIPSLILLATGYALAHRYRLCLALNSLSLVISVAGITVMLLWGSGLLI